MNFSTFHGVIYNFLKTWVWAVPEMNKYFFTGLTLPQDRYILSQSEDTPKPVIHPSGIPLINYETFGETTPGKEHGLDGLHLLKMCL